MVFNKTCTFACHTFNLYGARHVAAKIGVTTPMVVGNEAFTITVFAFVF